MRAVRRPESARVWLTQAIGSFQLAACSSAALYMPAGFLPHVNPQLIEMVVWLDSHVHNERDTHRGLH